MKRKRAPIQASGLPIAESPLTEEIFTMTYVNDITSKRAQGVQLRKILMDVVSRLQGGDGDEPDDDDDDAPA
jgi:hypothetical protein